MKQKKRLYERPQVEVFELRQMLYKAGGNVEFSSQSRFAGCTIRPVME